MAAEIILWISVCLLAYTYLVYPAVALITASNVRHKSRKSSSSTSSSTSSLTSTSSLPPVSILMPVHNEEMVIRQKIQCLLTSDYPRGLVEILIGSDASDDTTDSIIKEFAIIDDRIIFYRSGTRAGKSAMLNDL
ncbi:MAG TPA: glycosyltransferase, partial [Bacteroidales bacterium]|nr:glycosyltransferase [Bacteroidales bacterium]